MRKLALGFVASIMTATSALAGDPMESRYDNTVTLTDSNGVTKLHYNRDGTLRMVLPNGQEGTGKWAVKDAKLCVTLDAGPNKGVESCNPLVERQVGEEWEVPLPDGSKIKAKLEAGRA
jgi:hypothetical protein